MTALSDLVYQLYAKTIVLLTYMLIEFTLIIMWYLKSDTPPIITTTQYLNFIEEKNPTIHYTKRLKKQPSEHVDCRVCLSEFEEGDKVRNLNCEHTFHKDCIDKWFLQEQYCATCPLCRNKVLPDDVIAKYSLLQNQVEYDGNDDQLMVLFSALRGSSSLYGYL